MLTGILAQVSREALQGEGLDAVLQAIVDCLLRRLPVALASIILLDDEAAFFVHEVWAGKLDLDQPAGAPGSEPWPVSKGAAGRCARTGQAQLLTDVDDDPDYVPGHDSVRAEYLMPIRHHGRLLGVLNLESTESDFSSPRRARCSMRSPPRSAAPSILRAWLTSWARPTAGWSSCR
ncbi:GAF domain-containing protein [Arenimonas daejeonensis]|uniref:GAF domain-containing protein n=1 Tax=Arenimonas daejeonensis TaxID=370777 RepID=UPI0011BDBB76|nr:GAF domain-containing protein [Arenimonas daejeonensis]